MSTFSTSSRQKRLKTLSFLHFWLRNVLRATTACTFSTLFRHLNLQKWSEHVVFCTFWLGNVLRATTACTFSTSQLPKVVRSWCVLYILTWKCASRHNGVHFFDIATSKSGPRMVCFVHFDLQMCFAPQRRALFRHLNFQKWSDIGVFCTFWLANVLRATTACTFSTSQLPKVVRHWCVLYILTWKCASRHNGVHFFISHLASWLRTRRFSEPTFRPSRATNHWKNTVNRDFPTFSRICIFFLLIFSLLTLLTSAFQLSILSEVSLLNFLRPEGSYVRFLISNLPYGNLLPSYWKWPFVVDFPINSMVIKIHSYVSHNQRVSSMADDLWIFMALMALDHPWLIMASPAIFCGCRTKIPLPGQVREIPAKTVWNLGRVWVGFPVRSCAIYWDQNIQKPCKTPKKNHTPCSPRTSIHMQSPNFTEISEREDIKGPLRPTQGKTRAVFPWVNTRNFLRSAQLGGPVRGWRNFEYPHQLDEMTAFNGDA